MNRFVSALAISATVASAAFPTEAADTPIKADVLVESLDEYTAKCGIEERGLRAAVAYPLQASGFDLVGNKESEITVYVNVLADQPAPGVCIGKTSVEFYFYAKVPNPWDSDPVLREVQICSTGTLISKSRGTMAAAIYEQVERAAKDCIGEMKSE